MVGLVVFLYSDSFEFQHPMGDKIVRNVKILVFLCKMKTLPGFKELDSELKCFVINNVKLICVFRGIFLFSKSEYSRYGKQC